LWIAVVPQHARHDRAARGRSGIVATSFAHIGDERPSPSARDTKPRAAGLEITSGEDAGESLVRPPMRACRGPRVVFVTIRSDDKRVMRMCIQCDDCEAHVSEAASLACYAQRSCEPLARRLIRRHRIRERDAYRSEERRV